MALPIQIQKGTSKYRTYKIAGYVGLLLLLFFVAFAFANTASIEVGENTYRLGLLRVTKAVSFMVAILGLQVVAGFTGQLSLGQGFFFGTGAYISAWLVADQGWPWLATLAIVIPATFILGLLFGLPALRIKGLYLALVTLGLAAVFPSLILLDILEPFTGGAAGKLVDFEMEPPGWLPLDGISDFLNSLPVIGGFFEEGGLSDREEERVWRFTVLTLLAAICFKLASNLVKSRPGRAMRAIRDNETSAAVNGISLSYYKTMSFGVASALGGIGGTIYVAELGIASQGDFTQLLSILFIVGLVVGGVGTLSGAIIGGLVITFIPDWASSTTEVPGIPERWLDGPVGGLMLGILLIVLTFVLPGGVIAGVRQIRAKFVQILPQLPPLLGGAAASSSEPVVNLANGTGEMANGSYEDMDEEQEELVGVGDPDPSS